MIKAVKLKHFRSHEVTEITFGKGTNILIGPMGAGKTSVLDAICLAFFGTFPALKARRIKLEDVISDRPNRYEEATAEVYFDANGETYSVERIVSRNGTEARLRHDGKVIESAPQRVTEYVEKLLGVDYELFTRAVYSEQNRLDSILTLSRTERKKQVDQLLGIDVFENARSTATSVTNRLKTGKSAEAAVLEGLDADTLNARLSELENDARDAEARTRKNREEAGVLAIKATALTNELAKLDETEKAYNALQTDKAAEQARLEALKLELSQTQKKLARAWTKQETIKTRTSLGKLITTAKSRRDEYKRGSGEVERARGEAASLSREISSRAAARDTAEELRAKLEDEQANRLKIKQKFETASKENASMALELNRLSADAEQFPTLEKQTKEINALLEDKRRQAATKASTEEAYGRKTRELSDAHARLDALKASIRALEGADAHCPVCDSPLEQVKREAISATRKQERESLERIIEALAPEQMRLSEEIENANSAVAETAMLAERLTALKEKLVVATSSYKLLPEKRRLAEEAAKTEAALATELKLIEGKTAELEREAGNAAELERLGKQLAAAKATVTETEAKLASIGGVDEKELEDWEKTVREAELAEQSFVLAERVEDSKRKRNDIEIEQKHLGFNAATVRDKREELAVTSSLLARTEEKARAAADRAKEKTAEAEAFRQKAANVTARAKRIAALGERIEGMTKYSAALVETQARLREELVDAINSAMAELWLKIYPYKDYTSARMSATDDDYLLEVRTPAGEWKAVETVSGGERSCAALTLRTALAVVLTPVLSWLVLDEPTHNLDAKAVTLMSRALRDDLPTIVSQVFVITHDEHLKEAGTHVYKVERDKDGEDRTSVEALSLA